MNKQREALQMALEALDSKHNFNSAEWRVLHYRAFQVIREALAEPEKANQCGEMCERAKLCAVCANELAEPEPVAIGPEWTPCVKLPVTVHVRALRPGEAHVSTREGITPVKPDDLIMRGVSGEEYPIGREIFMSTYRLGTAPQPEQEPAAWRIADERDWEYRTKPPLETDIQWSAQYGRKYEPLYLSPPTRKPLTDHLRDATKMIKPLTDEKIMEICRELGKQCRLGGNPNIEFDYARAIERAHGIGGEA